MRLAPNLRHFVWNLISPSSRLSIKTDKVKSVGLLVSSSLQIWYLSSTETRRKPTRGAATLPKLSWKRIDFAGRRVHVLGFGTTRSLVVSWNLTKPTAKHTKRVVPPG